MNTTRLYVANLSDKICRAIHVQGIEWEKTGIIGGGPLRDHTQKLMASADPTGCLHLGWWMSDLLLEIWRRYGRSSLEDQSTDARANDQLQIVAAAIRIGKSVYSAPPPARHGDLIGRLVTDLRYAVMDHTDQGFLDSRGIFRERRPALMIAIKAGQVKKEDKDSVYLYSEDLW